MRERVSDAVATENPVSHWEFKLWDTLVFVLFFPHPCALDSSLIIPNVIKNFFKNFKFKSGTGKEQAGKATAAQYTPPPKFRDQSWLVAFSDHEKTCTHQRQKSMSKLKTVKQPILPCDLLFPSLSRALVLMYSFHSTYGKSEIFNMNLNAQPSTPACLKK